MGIALPTPLLILGDVFIGNMGNQRVRVGFAPAGNSNLIRA